MCITIIFRSFVHFPLSMLTLSHTTWTMQLHSTQTSDLVLRALDSASTRNRTVLLKHVTPPPLAYLQRLHVRCRRYGPNNSSLRRSVLQVRHWWSIGVVKWRLPCIAPCRINHASRDWLLDLWSWFIQHRHRCKIFEWAHGCCCRRHRIFGWCLPLSLSLQECGQMDIDGVNIKCAELKEQALRLNV